MPGLGRPFALGLAAVPPVRPFPPLVVQGVQPLDPPMSLRVTLPPISTTPFAATPSNPVTTVILPPEPRHHLRVLPLVVLGVMLAKTRLGTIIPALSRQNKDMLQVLERGTPLVAHRPVTIGRVIVLLITSRQW